MQMILVLNSPLFIEQTSTNREDYLPPIGLGIVATSLERHHKVTFIDLIAENYSVPMIIKKISDIKPDIVCINIFTTNYLLVKNIVEEDMTTHRWIIGGLPTKAFYTDIFNWNTSNPIDIVCGDGEKIVGDIVNAKVLEKPFEEMGNKRFYLINKDSIYYVNDLNDEILNREFFNNEPYLNVYNELEVGIYASRGCPHNCAFCGAAHSRNQDMGIRRKSSEKIIQEIEQLKQKNGNISCIRILDDLFLLDNNSMLSAARIFKRFVYKWRAMCHIKSLIKADATTLKELKESGCRELFIGIESGSERILRKLHKTIDKTITIKALTMLFDAGIDVKGYFVCGIPTETEEDLKKTFELATELKSLSMKKKANFRVSCFLFRPYCGTELYDEIVTQNNEEYYSILHKSIESKDFKGKQTFNFSSGNYSLVSDELLSNYIDKLNEMQP